MHVLTNHAVPLISKVFACGALGEVIGVEIAARIRTHLERCCVFSHATRLRALLEMHLRTKIPGLGNGGGAPGTCVPGNNRA